MKTNASLQKDVYEELKRDSRIPEGDIGVSAADGIVTLSGSIPTFTEKWAAEDAARRVAGVSAVVNKIEIKVPGTFARDDRDIAKSALDALKANIWVPDETIKITVERGWVTLSGQARATYQRKAAEHAIRHLSGVQGVTDEIVIGESPT